MSGDPMCQCGCGGWLGQCRDPGGFLRSQPQAFQVPAVSFVLETCERCWRPRFSRTRMLYEQPPDGVKTCPETHGVSCKLTEQQRNATLLRAYKRLADAQHKAILAFDAGAKPGHRTRGTISQAAALIHTILAGAPLSKSAQSAR